MNNEMKIEIAKALISMVWMKGKISDMEKAKSQAMVEEKLKLEKT
jgi:hypothetical protein